MPEYHNDEPIKVRISAKSLITDAVIYLDVEEWTRPVIRAALAVAEFMGGTKRTANPKLEDVGRVIKRSGRRAGGSLSVICRRADERHEPRHMFIRRLMASGKNKGRKASVYEVDPEFEAMVMQAREERTPYRKRTDLQDSMVSARSMRPTGHSAPTYRTVTPDPQDTQGVTEAVVRTPYVKAEEREKPSTDRSLPLDSSNASLDEQARKAALYYLGITRRKKPTEVEIERVAGIAMKPLSAGYTLDTLKSAARGFIERAKSNDYYAERRDDPTFVWKVERIDQHATNQAKRPEWERVGFDDPWSYEEALCAQCTGYKRASGFREVSLGTVVIEGKRYCQKCADYLLEPESVKLARKAETEAMRASIEAQSEALGLKRKAG